MIRIVTGNLFDSNAQTLVNTVNCVGVMGKGIALEFKKRFPDMFKDDVNRCQQGQVRLGYPYLYRSLMPPWILNFPTKDHWRSVGGDVVTSYWTNAMKFIGQSVIILGNAVKWLIC